MLCHIDVKLFRFVLKLEVIQAIAFKHDSPNDNFCLVLTQCVCMYEFTISNRGNKLYFLSLEPMGFFIPPIERPLRNSPSD